VKRGNDLAVAQGCFDMRAARRTDMKLGEAQSARAMRPEYLDRGIERHERDTEVSGYWAIQLASVPKIAWLRLKLVKA
jgi:hypothetical protein